MKKHPRLKKILLWLIGGVLCFALVLNPIATVVIYEIIFSARYETASWMAFDPEEFDGLQMDRSDFATKDGTVLAGYQYFKDGQETKGVVVLAHGYGGGGQNSYMPLIDSFTSNGYFVFAYDATGNDQSGGEDVQGLPQGVIDLDHAIDHVQQLEVYQDLPIVLFGHSWGAYSVGNVLNFHPEVKAVVMVAGFNESEDMLYYESSAYVGPLAKLELPYLSLYEQIKFGAEYTSITAVEGIESSDAAILIIQSEDDASVPMEYGYDDFYGAFKESDRVSFRLYEDRGHNYLFYSEASYAYRERLNADYAAYVQLRGGEYNAQVKEEFMSAYLDKKQCFEPDPELMAQILALYDSACQE